MYDSLLYTENSELPGSGDAHNCHTQLPPNPRTTDRFHSPFQLKKENCTPLHFPSLRQKLVLDRSLYSTRVKGRSLASIHDVTCRRRPGLDNRCEVSFYSNACPSGEGTVRYTLDLFLYGISYSSLSFVMSRLLHRSLLGNISETWKRCLAVVISPRRSFPVSSV